LGFMAALADRGLKIAPFKVGPDFIDPGHHTRITGVISRNLDGWMLSKSTNRQCFFQNARRADIAVVEGVMGLFDGYDGKSEAGSTAQMAKWLNLPVILVVSKISTGKSCMPVCCLTISAAGAI
jgi:cobyrinic acid a,c-diamide synthase